MRDNQLLRSASPKELYKVLGSLLSISIHKEILTTSTDTRTTITMASDDNLYDYYKPNKIVAIVFAAFFLSTSVIHTWKIFTTRQWFGIVILLGGLCMCSIHAFCQSFGNGLANMEILI